jgi:hypothetical protein
MTAHSRSPTSTLPLFGLLLSGALCACDGGDTVVALNVNFAPTASAARTIAVTITQSGQSATDSTLSLPTKDSDAGLVLKDTRFVQRITLPESYTDTQTTITVVAKDAAGATIDTGTANIDLRPNKAIAAFVTVGKDSANMPTTAAGQGDAGAEEAGAAEEAAGSEGAAGSVGAAGSAGAAGAAGK